MLPKCVSTETITLTAQLHSAEDHFFEKMSQHCLDIALELLQKKREDIVSQLTPLLSHICFKSKDVN